MGNQCEKIRKKKIALNLIYLPVSKINKSLKYVGPSPPPKINNFLSTSVDECARHIGGGSPIVRARFQYIVSNQITKYSE